MDYDRQLLKGTVAIMVVKLLSENDMYGYQIIKELERRSERLFSLNEGALYPVLHKLETEGHISAYWEPAAQGRQRKYYHLTPKGGALCRAKLEEWRRFSDTVNLVVGGTEHGKINLGLFGRGLCAHS